LSALITDNAVDAQAEPLAVMDYPSIVRTAEIAVHVFQFLGVLLPINHTNSLNCSYNLLPKANNPEYNGIVAHQNPASRDARYPFSCQSDRVEAISPHRA